MYIRTLHYVTFLYIALHCMTLHYIAFLPAYLPTSLAIYVTFCCVTLPRLTLRYIALRYITQNDIGCDMSLQVHVAKGETVKAIWVAQESKLILV